MPTRLPRRTRLALLLTHIGVWAERVVLAIWPLIAVILCGLGALFLFSFDQWPLEALSAAIALAGVGVTWGLYYALRHFSWPSPGAARARLDDVLDGRPLQAIDDAQAIGTDDPGAQGIWAAHLQKMQDRAAQAQAVAPNLRVARYDPFALRYAALLLAIIGLLFGSVYAVRDVSLAGPGQVASGPSWEGWVKPPSYTKLPTVYLNDVMGQTLTVPQDSTVMLRLYGDIGTYTVDETVSARTEGLTSAADASQEFGVAQSGHLSVQGDGGAAWSIVATPDQPPMVEVLGDITTDGQGQFSQEFSATDDYGVVEGRAWISLNLAEVDRRHGLAIDPMDRPAVELQLPLTISGKRTDFSETLVEDLSKNLWAHQPVSIVFEVEDIRGQIGQSASLEVLLPARNFFDPMAKALIEQRRDILWAPQNLPRVAQILRSISLTPDDVFRDLKDAKTLVDIIGDLEELAPETAQPKQIDDLAELLWALALEIEDGELADAAEALARAQDKLAEAIRNGASKEEIQRLMEELRQAQKEFMQEFAERNPPDQNRQQQQGQDGETVTQDQLQEMMDRLQKLMEEGRMAEAQELLEEINRLMENLQTTESQQGQQGQNEGQQSMEGLADTLRDQQGLSDETFQDLQNQGQPQEGQTQPGQQGQGQGEGQQQGQGQGDAGDDPQQGRQGQSLADRQEALRQELQRQRGNLPSAGTPGGDAARRALDQAGEAMDRAEDSLRNGDLPGALDNQSQAMEALRQGMRDLGEALAEERQQGQGDTPQNQQNAQNQSQQRNNRDPLGRDSGNSGQLGAGEDMLPTEELRRRSQDLMDEIRRRSGSLDRPKDERDYLRRLLDQF